MPKIAVKKLDERAVLPTYGSEYAAGADLYAVCDGEITIAPDETKLIHTGLSMEIPEGYAGFIYARSGLASKRGLAPANKVGVVDADYRGEVMVALHNHSGVEQKIAQCANLFSFLPMSVGALKTHAENGLLKTDGLLWVVLPALALSAISVSLAAALPSSILRRGFGVFLIGLSFVGFYKEWAGKNKKKTDIANG